LSLAESLPVREQIASGNAVEFRHVTVCQGGLTILDDINAVIPAGSCTVIVGPNGAGKTTLLLALLGQVRFRGSIVTPGSRFPRVGYVPQRLDLDRAMPLTVTEFMVLGHQKTPLWLGTRAAHRRRAEELLDQVRAGHLARRRMGDLSGGETQRVLLALALGQKPELLILDEASSGVDINGGMLFCELLDEMRLAWGYTQVMVSHDLGTVAHHATHVIGLKGRVLAEGSPPDVLNSKVLAELFGHHMGIIQHCRGDVCPDCTCSRRGIPFFSETRAVPLLQNIRASGPESTENSHA